MTTATPSRPCPHTPCFRLQPCSEHARKPFQRYTPRRQPEGSGWAWQRKRTAILERDGYRCRLQLEGCTGAATVVDHQLNVTRGGSDDPANLVAACANCNERKRRREARA